MIYPQFIHGDPTDESPVFAFDHDTYVATLLGFVFLSMYCPTDSLENTRSLTIRFPSFTKSMKSAGSGSFPCFLLISRILLDHLSLAPRGSLDKHTHNFRSVQNILCLPLCNIITFKQEVMKLSICFSIFWFNLWPLLDIFTISCNYSVWISIQLMHHLLCNFISFLWRKLYAIFDHLLYFPSSVFNQMCKLPTWVFNLVFNSFIKDNQKIVKLQWFSTKHYNYLYLFLFPPNKSTSMLADVSVDHLSSRNYILVSCVFFHIFTIFGLCLWIAYIFLYFLPANLSQDFCLGSGHSSSFFVGLSASFLQLQTSI